MKERVDYGSIIGTWRGINGEELPSTIGIIVYDKAGMIHVYPGKPVA